MKKTITAALVGLAALTGMANAGELRIVNHSGVIIHATPIDPTGHLPGVITDDTLVIYGGQQASYYPDHLYEFETGIDEDSWSKTYTAREAKEIDVQVDLAGFEPGRFTIPEGDEVLIIEFWGTVFKVWSQNKTIEGGQQINPNAERIWIR